MSEIQHVCETCVYGGIIDTSNFCGYFDTEIIDYIDYDAEYECIEGWERTLRSKFSCSHCSSFDDAQCPWCHEETHPWQCVFFKLTEEIKAMIKLKDIEICKTKIDSHPRHLIGKITPLQSLEYSKDGKRCLHNYITNTTVELRLIL